MPVDSIFISEPVYSTVFQESLVLVELSDIMESELLSQVQDCNVLVSKEFFNKLIIKSTLPTS